MDETQDNLRMKKMYKPIKLLATCIIIIVSFSIITYGWPHGIADRTRKGPYFGCTCHHPSPSANVVVTINGPDTLAPYQTANYSVTIKGGPLVRAGTDIAVSGGTLAPVSSDLHFINEDLTHTTPKAPDSLGVVAFEFTYTAPSDSEEQTIYANGNSVNFDSTSSGDEWNFAPNKTIMVTIPTGVEDKMETPTNYNLSQNYPNPFNPTTNIQFTVPKTTELKINVYTVLGEKVLTPANGKYEPGSYKVEVNASALPSGIYLYRIESKEFTSTKKMIYLK